MMSLWCLSMVCALNTFSTDQWDDGSYFGIVTSINIVLLW